MLVAVLGLGLIAPVAVAAPAFAATAPVGDETTPGIWNTHTVTFRAGGADVASVQVVDGGLAPRQPAPTAPDEVFAGWFTSVSGAEVPFDFDATVITADLVVTARFTDARIVQFLAPPVPGEPPRALDTDEVGNGDPLGDIAPDVPDVPDGRVFTGAWYLQGDASQTPYDFAQPVTRNLVLLPILAAGFAVSFVTDGTAVDPDFVLEPQTEFTRADLDAIPAPSRTGYVFTQWWADAARTQEIVFPITAATTLYAGWTGEVVS